MDIVAAARALANDVLFPAALSTDAADVVPVELVDALANAELYGLPAPIERGGVGADFTTTCAVVEALASGCLTTTFVWAQHLGGLRATIFSQNEAMRNWVGPLARGDRRAGLALGDPTDDGWRFDGTSPFVSGWGRIDVMHTAARTEDGRLVWALVDAGESDALVAQTLRLVALNATRTVSIRFRSHEVPASRVTSVEPYNPGPTPPEVLRIHASFALGVAARCCQLLGPTSLKRELEQRRAKLDRLEPQTIEADRAAAGELALRCAAALVVTRGSRSLLMADHAQRLAREALFTLVYAHRPGSREALQALLASGSG